MSHRELPLCSLLCVGTKEHWHTIVSRLVVLHMQPSKRQYQGTSVLAQTAGPVTDASTHVKKSNTFCIIYGMDFISENISFPQVPLKKMSCGP